MIGLGSDKKVYCHLLHNTSLWSSYLAIFVKRPKMPIVENRTPSHQNSNAFHAFIGSSQFGGRPNCYRVTIIVGLPTSLTSFWIISSQIFANILKFPLEFSISSQPGWQLKPPWPVRVLKGTAVFHLMQRFCSTGPLKFHFPLKIAEACFSSCASIIISKLAKLFLSWK